MASAKQSKTTRTPGSAFAVQSVDGTGKGFNTVDLQEAKARLEELGG
jgi:hypothetical protein